MKYPSHKPFSRFSKKPENVTNSKKPTTFASKSPIPKKDPDAFPMRINKYLALKGFATRRDADKLIEKKGVTINGRFAVLGDKVNSTDIVQVRNNKKASEYVYYAYNKPRGLRTEETRKNSNDIISTISLKGVFPVGSLDPNTEGLVILTNDRRIIDRMMNPQHLHEKEYFACAMDPLRSSFKQKMEDGVTLGDGQTVACKVRTIDQKHFTIRFTGNNNPIRQMCSLLFTELDSLKRTRILNIELGKLPSNEYRPIEGQELEVFLKSLGL
ncbi:MAG: pseudouridine synthase [Candidatus Paceibacterota bacterium]|jgi:23S rRNA pseudouridine2604 synthase